MNLTFAKDILLRSNKKSIDTKNTLAKLNKFQMFGPDIKKFYAFPEKLSFPVELALNFFLNSGFCKHDF